MCGPRGWLAPPTVLHDAHPGVRRQPPVRSRAGVAGLLARGSISRRTFPAVNGQLHISSSFSSYSCGGSLGITASQRRTAFPFNPVQKFWSKNHAGSVSRCRAHVDKFPCAFFQQRPCRRCVEIHQVDLAAFSACKADSRQQTKPARLTERALAFAGVAFSGGLAGSSVIDGGADAEHHGVAQRPQAIGVGRIGDVAARIDDVLEVRLDGPTRHDLRLVGRFQHRFVGADGRREAGRIALLRRQLGEVRDVAIECLRRFRNSR